MIPIFLTRIRDGIQRLRSFLAHNTHGTIVACVVSLCASSSYAAQVVYDFQRNTGGAGSSTVTQTDVGSGYTLIFASLLSVLLTDDGANGGLSNIQSPLQGNIAYNDIANLCEKKITVSIQSGPLFNLDAIDLQETFGDPVTLTLTSSRGGTASHAFAGGDATTYNTASDPSFQNISSFTITASGNTGYCYYSPGGDAASFYLAADNIKLSNIHFPTYSVTYNGNGNTGGAVPADATVYSSGNTVTVLGNTGSLARTGYTFNNWNTASNGSGATYAGGGTFSIAAEERK